MASNLNLTDEATCYKMFRRSVLEQIILEENGFGFCPEITAKISKLGLKIYKVPISYSARTRAEGKKIRLRDGLSAIRCIVKYNWLRCGGKEFALGVRAPAVGEREAGCSKPGP